LKRRASGRSSSIAPIKVEPRFHLLRAYAYGQRAFERFVRSTWAHSQAARSRIASSSSIGCNDGDGGGNNNDNNNKADLPLVKLSLASIKALSRWLINYVAWMSCELAGVANTALMSGAGRRRP
jgi:hypothetical protein